MTREKYLNEQFEGLMQQYRASRGQLQTFQVRGGGGGEQLQRMEGGGEQGEGMLEGGGWPRRVGEHVNFLSASM